MSEKYTLRYLKDIQSKDVDWLWYPYIPYGKITIVQGDPGEGKTTFILSLLARLSSNGYLPCSEKRLFCNSIYQNTEDDIADTIKPRLEKHSADCSKICFIEKSDLLLLDDNCIESAIQKANAKVFVLDPLQAFVGENIDMNRASSMRPRLNKLKKTAEKTGCAIILIGHLNKKAGGKSDYRGLGSIDIQAAARSVLFVGTHNDYPNMRFVVQQKNNLAPLGDTLAFSLKSGIVEWLGKFPMSVNDLVNNDMNIKKTKEQRAIQIISNLLIDGKQRTDYIMKCCEAEDISERTVNNAKTKLGVNAIRENGSWYWCFNSK